jgi:hypothetical protein
MTGIDMGNITTSHTRGNFDENFAGYNNAIFWVIFEYGPTVLGNTKAPKATRVGEPRSERLAQTGHKRFGSIALAAIHLRRIERPLRLAKLEREQAIRHRAERHRAIEA